jgi:hypothetical protein
VKRCGKSAPRVRQRNRHGKPHREQDRIGMATRVVRESENACGSDVRLAVRVGCSRQRASVVPEEWPSRLGRGNAGKALQNPAYRPADTDQRGVRRERAGPLAISRAWPEMPFRRYALPCERHIAALLLGKSAERSIRGNVLSRALSCIRAATVLAAIAVAAAGCAAANNATSAQASSQGSNQGEQPYKTMYGITSEGTTSDLYTEFFGSRQPPPAPAPAVAAAQPVQPVTTQPVAPAQQNAAAPGPTRSGRTTAASRTPTQPAPQPTPVQSVQVAQQPTPPAPPPEPDVPTAYGIPANGHTTDLYTAIFGPRRSDGQ